MSVVLLLRCSPGRAVLLLVVAPATRRRPRIECGLRPLLYHLLVFWVSMSVGEELGGDALERRVPPWLIALGILSFLSHYDLEVTECGSLARCGSCCLCGVSRGVEVLVFLGSRFILRSHKLAALSSSVAQHSYEMYLIHYCLISVMVTLGIGWPGIVLLLPLSFVAAILVRGIARPLIDLITSFVFRPSEGRERRA